jgi:hypothetical protein
MEMQFNYFAPMDAPVVTPEPVVSPTLQTFLSLHGAASVSDLARRLGLKPKKVHSRLERGWAAEKAFGNPPPPDRREMLSRACIFDNVDSPLPPLTPDDLDMTQVSKLGRAQLRVMFADAAVGYSNCRAVLKELQAGCFDFAIMQAFPQGDEVGIRDRIITRVQAMLDEMGTPPHPDLRLQDMNRAQLLATFRHFNYVTQTLRAEYSHASPLWLRVLEDHDLMFGNHHHIAPAMNALKAADEAGLLDTPCANPKRAARRAATA